MTFDDHTGPYLFHVFRGAAVNVTARATLTKQTGCNITQSQKAIAVILANDSLATEAFGAFAASVGHGNGARNESADGKVELHFDRWLKL